MEGTFHTTPEPRFLSRKALATTVGLAIVLVLSGLATHLIFTRTQMLVEPRVSLDRYFDGTVARPFSNRFLVPQLTAMLAHVVPQSLADGVCGEPPRWSACASMPKDSAELPPYFALAIVLFGSAVAFAIVMGQTYRKLFRAPEWATWTTAAATLLGISVVIRYGGYGHIYDFSVLALTAAMLSALFFERLTLYLILFVVACWTKETTIFMAIAYFAIYWDRLPRRRLFLHLAIQGLAFVAAYATLRLLFRNNEGVPIEDWASKQLAWFLAKPVRRTVMLAAGAAAIFFAWGEKPVSLRRALMPVAPHVALFVIGAQPAELRSLYESAPVVMLFVFRNIALLCGRLGHAGRSLVPQQQ